MSYSDNKEQWYRDMITDHYQTPRNKGLVDDATYQLVHLKNPSCGDDLMVQAKVEGDTVADVRFEGSGCAICCASASMMTENVKAKSIEDADCIIHEFYKMVSGDASFNEDILQDAISLQGVAKLPPRIKCATLGYKALQQLLFNEAVTDDDIEEIK